jgi:aminopeptidase N
VPGLNIARSEAAERSAHLLVASYDVTLDLTTGEETFYSKSVIHFSCNTPGYDTFIDAVGKSIISATLNGEAVDTADFDGETVFLKNLAAENELIIEVEAIYSKTGEGLQRSVDPVDNEVYLYSQGEIADIRRMFACWDQPDLKATIKLTATVPGHWEVISNNPIESKTVVEAGKVRWAFTPTPRISTYLAAIIAGPYQRFSDEYVGKKVIPLGLYVRRSFSAFADPEDIFLLTKQGFSFFERVMGLVYPFDKYDQIAVVDFNAGAMENVGAVTFAEDSFIFRSKVTDQSYAWRANVIFHEMAHMWFGNMVTMSWWDDLWLNESFAEWASYQGVSEGTRFVNSWVTFNIERKNWGYREDTRSSTHPIVTDMVDLQTVAANFDGISYAKGASVLKQLATHVGIENFIAGLSKYFAKYAWKNTTLKDLLDELEAASGRDLTSWAATWLQTSGVNTLRPILEIVDGKYKSISIAQEVPTIPAHSAELRPHRLAVGLYDLTGDQLLLRKSIELDIAGALTSVDGLVGESVADLLLINDRDLTYAKIRFDDRSLETLKSHLGKIVDPLARVLCWSAAWDMVRDAQLSASDFLTLALSGLQTEKDITIIRIVVAQLSQSVYNYSHSSHRDELATRLADGFESLMNNALPDSDQQLSYTRAFASTAKSDSQQARIGQLLSGTLAGLTIDSDLRWYLLNCQATFGLIGADELDAELVNDNTFSGQLAHAGSLAAMPTPEAKAKTWHALLTEDLGTAMRSSLLAGFPRPNQLPLLEIYIDKYFDSLLDLWGKKSYEVASGFVKSLYPSRFASQSTLDKTNDWLDGNGRDAHSSLRRMVIDGLDEMGIALRAQNRDA